MIHLGWTPRREEPRWMRVVKAVLTAVAYACIVVMHLVAGFFAGVMAPRLSTAFLTGATHLACAALMLAIVAMSAASARRYLFTAPDFALLVTMPLAPRALFARRMKLLAQHELGSAAALAIAVALAAAAGSGHSLAPRLFVATAFVAAGMAAGIALAFHDALRRLVYTIALLVVASLVTVAIPLTLDPEGIGIVLEWVSLDPLPGTGGWWPLFVLLALALAAIAFALPRYTMQRIAAVYAAAYAPLRAGAATDSASDRITRWLAARWGARRIAVLTLLTLVAEPHAVWPRTRRVLAILAPAFAVAFAIRLLLPVPWMYFGTALLLVTLFFCGLLIASDAGTRDQAASAAVITLWGAPSGPLIGRSPFATRGMRNHPVIATLPLPVEEAVRASIRFQLTGLLVWLALASLVLLVYPFERLIVAAAVAMIAVAVALGAIAGPIQAAGSYIQDPRRSRKARFLSALKPRIAAILAGLGMAALFVAAELTRSNWVLAALPVYMLLVALLGTLVTWRRVRWWHRHHRFDAEYPPRTLPMQRW